MKQGDTISGAAATAERAPDVPGVPIMQQAAERVAASAEAIGLKAIPLYFAANLVASGGEFHVFGRLRFDFSKAIEDGKENGSAVSFVVQIARPDNELEMKCHAASVKERDSGLEFGATRKSDSANLH
jgi:hypothetical protein